MIEGRLYFNLQEASKIANCNPIEFLLIGARGNIRLCILQPDVLLESSFIVYLVERFMLPKSSTDSSQFRPRPIIERRLNQKANDVSGLVLSKDDCSKLSIKGYVEQYKFDLAYSLIGENLVLIPINEEQEETDTFTYEGSDEIFTTTFSRHEAPVFVLCHQSNNQSYFSKEFLKSIRIEESDLWIARHDLKNFISETSNAVKVNLNSSEVASEHAQQSEKLKYLIKASMKFWYEEAKPKSPKTELGEILDLNDYKLTNRQIELINHRERKIVEYLKPLKANKNIDPKQGLLFESKTSLKAAVDFIRPDLLRSSQKVSNDEKMRAIRLGSPKHASKLLNALVDVVETTPDLISLARKEIEELLIQNKKFSKNEASLGAKILRHEGKPMGAPKKLKKKVGP